MAKRRLMVEFWKNGVIISAGTNQTDNFICNYPLGLDTVAEMTGVMNAVVFAMREREEDIRTLPVAVDKPEVGTPLNICPDCGGEMVISGGIDDGTHYYECKKCGYPTTQLSSEGINELGQP